MPLLCARCETVPVGRLTARLPDTEPTHSGHQSAGIRLGAMDTDHTRPAAPTWGSPQPHQRWGTRQTTAAVAVAAAIAAVGGAAIFAASGGSSQVAGPPGAPGFGPPGGPPGMGAPGMAAPGAPACAAEVVDAPTR
ncbi:uncharacterized protein PO2_contig-098-22 [Mycobacterium sp. PO2]|nr:uncharacterized protein PO2_contig-098-22 [Mycobacterium sp. PO2]